MVVGYFLSQGQSETIKWQGRFRLVIRVRREKRLHICNEQCSRLHSMAGVGTQKVFENDRVTVWHLDLEPGEQGERHTHELDYVIRILSGSTLEVSGPDGELLDTVELEAGGAVSFQIQGDQIVSDRPGYPAVPATHSARNIGSNTFREVLIEFKK